ISWLRHPSADIRFWAAYGLTNLRQTMDISPALNDLDQIVAFDHRVPVHWGWHVDREAVEALETIYYYPFPQDNEDFFPSCCSYLISPAPEYFTFVTDYRRWTETWEYSTQPTPPVILKIEPEWLASQLEQRWQGIVLNNRQPRPHAYVLDWQLEIDGEI